MIANGVTHLRATRIGPTLQPNPSRVLIRPFWPSREDIARHIISRVLSLTDQEVDSQLQSVLAEFGDRHGAVEKFFMMRFSKMRRLISGSPKLSENRRMLIGSFFTHEYSLESAALFNPSIVPHPDQSGLAPGAQRFILSLRATGEGHISSITFREGIANAKGKIELSDPAPIVAEPDHVPNALYEKPLFKQKLQEAGIDSVLSEPTLEQLGDSFTIGDLRRALPLETGVPAANHTARGMELLAQSNYQVAFEPDQPVSQRVIFPVTPSQSNGIEDARFVRFQKEKGGFTYYATYTAYDGKIILPQLLETPDFLHFKFITLNGPAVQNKGMALFPRKINGRYFMLSRQDDENILLMSSDNIHFWSDPKILLSPQQPWEFVKLGNCGSPIETEAGWLVLSHGVGAMRKYCLGAFLLDLENPSRVIGRLPQPLLSPNEGEREGYVPNVVYTCGCLLHGRNLIIPYAMSDSATSFATVDIGELLAAME
jgi:predicted GH43/DUF377 family glycosyl hydrolase